MAETGPFKPPCSAADLEAALASAHDQLADLSREPWPEDDDEEEPDPG